MRHSYKLLICKSAFFILILRAKYLIFLREQEL